jgi:hypothetical protein
VTFRANQHLHNRFSGIHGRIRGHNRVPNESETEYERRLKELHRGYLWYNGKIGLSHIRTESKQMARWTEQGERLVNDVANRYGVSYDAVSMMLDSVLRGNGTMAQFNINELGGGGQWMRGGMTMVGDMFNYSLKSKVDGICGELSSAICDQNMQVVPPPPPRSSGSGGGQSQGGWNQWWPAELGSPNTSGSQNQYRYAYFAGARRLAITDGHSVTVYDTLDHNIGGVSQQQGGSAGVSFTSQYGTIDLRTLPLVSGPPRGSSLDPAPTNPQATAPPQASPTEPMRQDPPAAPLQSMPPATGSSTGVASSADDIFAMIEKLAKLRDAGAVSEDEFQAKKTELLSRL